MRSGASTLYRPQSVDVKTATGGTGQAGKGQKTGGSCFHLSSLPGRGRTECKPPFGDRTTVPDRDEGATA